MLLPITLLSAHMFYLMMLFAKGQLRSPLFCVYLQHTECL